MRRIRIWIARYSGSFHPDKRQDPATRPEILFRLVESHFRLSSPRCAEGRATAQEALWNRLGSLSAGYAGGPDELESLAAYVRGVGPHNACGPLVQQVVGQLFSPNFKATTESWNAALVLNQAPRTLNLPLLAWWKITRQTGSSKENPVRHGRWRSGRSARYRRRCPQYRERRKFNARTLQRPFQSDVTLA